MNELDVVKTIFGFYVVGDWKGAQGLIHPDAEVFFPGQPGIVPWAGRYQGREIKKFFDAVKDSLDILEYTINAFHHAGSVVTMQAFERCRVRSNGQLITNEHAGIARVQDGLMVSYREYADTAALHVGLAHSGGNHVHSVRRPPHSGDPGGEAALELIGVQRREDMDVAIVGGGYCGISLARLLADRGIRVTVLERGGRIARKTRTLLLDDNDIEMGTCYIALDYGPILGAGQRYGMVTRPLGRATANPASVLAPLFASDLRGMLQRLRLGMTTLRNLPRYTRRRAAVLRQFAAGDPAAMRAWAASCRHGCWPNASAR